MAPSASVSYKFISEQRQLPAAIDKLACRDAIALDIECDNNLHHFGTRVCLIQLSTPDGNFIIDAQAGLDLTALKKIMESERIEKVMHDTDFDMRCLDYAYGWRPKNLFDTQIAARLCGRERIGLAALIEFHFGKILSKRFQRADWSRRPLTDEMLSYAATDSHFLLELRDLLAAELSSAGRMEWAREEFRLCENKRYEPDERPAFARVKGAARLKGRPLAVLAALAEERECIARELDLPVHFVASAEALIRMALNPPRTKEDISRVRALHPLLRKDGAQRLLSAIEAGSMAQIPEWPRKRSGPRRHESMEMLDALKCWRLKAAKTERIDADLILPLEAMKRLSAGLPLVKVLCEPPVREWQRRRFAAEIGVVVGRFKPGRIRDK